MSYTAQEIMDYCREEEVQFIRLAFCDAYGTQKNISIRPAELRHAFEQGIGFDAVCGTMKYAFEELQLNRLYGGILEYNIPSQKLYKKCGWKEEGLYRQQVFKNNQYYDEIAVAILRSDYFEWKEKQGK